jgi:5-methylcytosine-specific restriction endonuclease McrA
MSIPKSLYATVRQRAQFRCEYCHYPELLSSAPLSIDHIQPQSFDGSNDPDNLALACRRCNEKRYNFTTGDERRGESFIQNARRQWVAGGIHPPLDDPQY